ncbi:hypothetical protein F9L07_27255 [Pimelobacter simplex]|uniref:DUF91 domain-containing protein n=1 Tax=Nocardioides simplex TaxID=2045 RepID=A0A7J5DR18_NOCSI|nr:hypothetical protein [Pimelobacter simplex]KAB2807190.1 hypothetical protein F9L07_27255 [Pimelobacter simplex]
MALPILVRALGGGWQEPEVTAYENEAALQELVKESPDLLSGEALATVDEFWVPGIGSIDLVGVAADGAITLIECKLRANPQIRREVVGQILAYAGGIWQMSYDEFAATWEARSGRSLLDHVRDKTGAEDAEAIRAGVVDSLARGVFTLVIAVDEITDELKRIIEFLNTVTTDSVTVLGLELQYVKQSDTEILIPRTYGDSLAEVKRKSSPTGRKWSAESFAAEVAALPAPEKQVVEKLMAHGAAHGVRPWWGVGQVPGMSWYYRVSGTTVSLFQIYLRPTGTVVAASIGGLKSAAGLGDAAAVRMLDGLRDVAQIAPSLDHVTADSLNKYPSIPVVGVLDQPGVIEAFLGVIDDVRDNGT